MSTELENKELTSNDAKPVLVDGLNGHYVIVGKKGNVHYHTLSCQRKTCIEKFLEGGIMTWKECREFGWRCLKVDVSFNLCR